MDNDFFRGLLNLDASEKRPELVRMLSTEEQEEYACVVAKSSLMKKYIEDWMYSKNAFWRKIEATIPKGQLEREGVKGLKIDEKTNQLYYEIA
jgi:hypothetical protein